MTTLFKGCVLGIAGLAVVVFVLNSDSSTAHARLQYRKQFEKTYKNMSGLVKEQKCNICHINKKSKKMRNAYGEVLAKVIGKKNQKDEIAIVKALKQVESEPSKVEGKTFGDLIKEGKPPATE